MPEFSNLPNILMKSKEFDLK